MNQEIIPPTFFRFIPATQVLKRWGLTFIEFKQLPQTPQIKLNAFIQKKNVDYGSLNPYSPYCGRARDTFGGIKKVTPISKEDFEHVMYDFYTLVQYEFHKPEIVKDRSVCPQLEEEFVKNCPEYIQEIDPPSPKKGMTISTPEGTTWSQIHFRIVNPFRIEITTPEGMVFYTPQQLGLFKKKKLHNLFEDFAKDIDCLQADRQDINRLRKHLKNIFPTIEGDPIPHNKKLKGYRTDFHIHIA